MMRAGLQFKIQLTVAVLASTLIQSCSSGEKSITTTQTEDSKSAVTAPTAKQDGNEIQDTDKFSKGDWVHSPLTPNADGVLDVRKELAALIHRHPARLSLVVMRYYDKLTKEDLAAFKTQEAVDTIKDLDIGRMNLNDEDFEAISGLKNLRSLNVRGNPVKDFHFLKPLQNLEYLDVDDCHITKEGAKAICTAPSGIQRLVARNATFDDDAWQFIGQSKTLRQIILMGVSVKPATLKQLQKDLPRCKIVIGKDEKSARVMK